MIKKIPGLSNITEASEKIGVTRKTIHQWINHGKIAVIHRNGLRYIPQSEIERLKHGSNES